VPEAKETGQHKRPAPQVIPAHPVMTLGEMITEGVRQGLSNIVISTIHQHLKVTLVTLKRVHVIYAMRTAPNKK
jgi:hypothetical protein